MGKKQKPGKKNNNSKKKGSEAEDQQQPSGKKKQNKRQGKHHYEIDDDDNQFRKSLEADGRYTIVEMQADGNCLFRALSDQLFHDYGNKHADIRSAVCSFIDKHEDEFSVFLVLDENEEDEDAKDFETYVSNMRQDGEWGGNLELVAAARLFQRNIMVFSAPLSAFTINHGGEQSTGENLHLSYHDNLHYSSVRDNKSSEKPSDANNVFGNLEQSYNAPKNGTKPTKQENEENEKPNEQRPPEDLEDTTHSNNPRPKQSTISPKMSKPKKGDPCPCGSGQKYKKCCLVKEKHAARLQKMKKKEEEVDPAKEDVEQQDANVEMNGKFRVLQI